ncbi:MAG: hypothetical protein IJH48_04760 [Oscillospiraceae bacterium]|nr:hypothetical protein [Oscillospiraceae bacterium]
MDESLFRKKSMERISSPESLSDYLRVTSPAVWLILTAVILLLAGLLIWSSAAGIDSFAAGTARVENGSMRVYFDDEQIAQNVQSGMKVIAGEFEGRIVSVGTDAEGRLFASADTTLADGNYPARVVFRRTQVLSLLFS